MAVAQSDTLSAAEQLEITHYKPILAWDDFDPRQLDPFVEAVQQSVFGG